MYCGHGVIGVKGVIKRLKRRNFFLLFHINGSVCSLGMGEGLKSRGNEKRKHWKNKERKRKRVGGKKERILASFIG